MSRFANGVLSGYMPLTIVVGLGVAGSIGTGCRGKVRKPPPMLTSVAGAAGETSSSRGSGGGGTGSQGGGDNTSTSEGASGEAGTAAGGSAGMGPTIREPVPCGGLSAYHLDGMGTLSFVPNEEDCNAYLAYYFFEPQIYDFACSRERCKLVPRESAAYWVSFGSWGAISQRAAQGVELVLDGSRRPISAVVDYYWTIENDDTSLIGTFVEDEYSVLPLKSTAHLRIDLPGNRGFLPWECVSVEVWPPVANFKSALQTTSPEHVAWQTLESGQPLEPPDSPDLGPPVYQPEPRQSMRYTQACTRPGSWQHSMADFTVHLVGALDLLDRRLDDTSIEIPIERLPAPRTSHEFDGEETTRAWGTPQDEPSTLPECMATGCLELQGIDGDPGVVAGVLDASAASTLRVLTTGGIHLFVYDEAADVVVSRYIEKGEDDWVSVELPIEPQAQLGFVLRRYSPFTLTPEYVDRIWVE